MDEDKDKVYIVRPVVKEGPKTSLQEQGQPEPSQPQSKESPVAGQTNQQTKPWKKMQLSHIPTDRIFKTITNRDMMMETLHDETLEPHVHLTILILIVIVMAIFISLLGL